jgi:maltose/moltooligosaccharide transporter
VLYDETGIYMGIFNFFIVIPEILAALVFGKVMETILTEESALVRLVGGDNRLTAVVLGGISLAAAATLCAFVTEPASTPYREVPVKTPADPPD